MDNAVFERIYAHFCRYPSFRVALFESDRTMFDMLDRIGGKQARQDRRKAEAAYAGGR